MQSEYDALLTEQKSLQLRLDQVLQNIYFTTKLSANNSNQNSKLVSKRRRRLQMQRDMLPLLLNAIFRTTNSNCIHTPIIFHSFFPMSKLKK